MEVLGIPHFLLSTQDESHPITPWKVGTNTHLGK